MRAPVEEDGTITRRRIFAQVPDALIDDMDVSGNAYRLWSKLDRYAGADGRAFPGRDVLAKQMHVSVSTVGRWIAELVDTGWITRKRRGFTNIIDTTLNDEPIPTMRKPAGHDGKRTDELTDAGTSQPGPESGSRRRKDEPSGKRKSGLSKEGDPLKENHKQEPSGPARSAPHLGTARDAGAATRRTDDPPAPQAPPPARQPEQRAAPRRRTPRTWPSQAAWSMIRSHPGLAVSPSRFKAAPQLAAFLAGFAAPEDAAAIAEQLAAVLPQVADDETASGRVCRADWAVAQAIGRVRACPETPGRIRATLEAALGGGS